MSSTAIVSDPAASPPSQVLRGHLALWMVQLCFGLFPVFVRFAYRGGFEARAILAWRLLVGSLAFGLLAMAVDRRGFLAARLEWRPLLVCALTGVALNQGLALEGMVRSTALNAALIMTLIPVFTVAIAALMGVERLSPRRLLGLPIAFAGAALAVFARFDGQGPALDAHTWGNLMMATNCLLYAFYLVYSRRLLTRMRVETLVAWIYILSLPFAPVALIGHSPLPDPNAGAGPWVGLVLILVFPTLLAYGLNSYALRRVPASVTAIYIYLQPLVAGVGGAVALGEEPPKQLFLAGLLLFVGIALAVYRPTIKP
jgi:drug/metabolite transporter (DMT)-like permease